MTADDYLKEAIKAIGDRAKERDIEAERSASRAAKMFSALTGKELSELEAWQFMCCLKLVRSATGKFKADDFVDLAGYAALAGESAEKNSLSFTEISKEDCEISNSGQLHLDRWYNCRDYPQASLHPYDEVEVDSKGFIFGPSLVKRFTGWGDGAKRFKIVKRGDQ